jgi:phospholipid/cholesterol/gamma-HCH transport system substrate-binding protein
MTGRSIEAKVGILVLLALALLGAFVLVLGGINLEPTLTVYVSFENPGALQAGAPVRLASIRIGKVQEIQFRDSELDPATKQAVPIIRAVATIEKRYHSAIRENSRFYVTTQGVLGETYLAIEPGSADRPLLSDGAAVQGVSPPRLDLLLAESYELLHRAYVGITKNDDKIAATFEDLHRTLRGTSELLGGKQDKLGSIIDNVEALSVEAKQTVQGARQQYVENPRIGRIIQNLDESTTRVNRELGPLLDDGRAALRDARKVTSSLAADEQLQRYEAITKNLSATSAHAERAAADAAAMTHKLKRGEGTVGALLADEALYDDVQELLRDLKRNPWKFFWKE